MRERNQLCHLYMLKLFVSRIVESEENVKEQRCTQVINATTDVEDEAFEGKLERSDGMLLGNAEIPKRIDVKLQHLGAEKKGTYNKYCKFA